MKKLTLLTIAALLSANVASAKTDIFNPSPATGTALTPPAIETLGTPYTQVVNGGASITYSPTSINVTDGTNNGGQAYITSAENIANLDTVHIHLTFTPTYSATDPTGGLGGQSNTTILELEPSSGSNNDVLSVDFQTLGFGNNDASVIISSGIAYGQGGETASGNQEYTSHGIDSLSGVTLTLNLTQVYGNSGGVNTVTTTGTLSDAQNSDLYNYDYVVMEANATALTGYDPSNSTGNGGLVYRTGLDSTGADSGFLNGPLSVKIASADVFVPEPSTYALMFCGLGLLAFVARRKLTA